MELIGEFGWTMEIIHNSTGGRLPKFWRPPYGDTDIRVQAIAKEIFGLTAILWNHECVPASLFFYFVGESTCDYLALVIGCYRREHH